MVQEGGITATARSNYLERMKIPMLASKECRHTSLVNVGAMSLSTTGDSPFVPSMFG